MEPKATVLYVEDNLENRMLIRRVLEAEGFRVILASGAAEALQVLQHEKPQLILIDVSMPEVDGYTLTRQIKGLAGFERVPIIALTANVMRGEKERALQAGCDGYIPKPVDIDMLPQQIESFLHR
ncbi:MAG: response regulator [Chloroflexi bacterium]|jgi:two-component system cell cycle response regulator DivK|nr:response regulator [Chloroflexota bacterium]